MIRVLCLVVLSFRVVLVLFSVLLEFNGRLHLTQCIKKLSFHVFPHNGMSSQQASKHNLRDCEILVIVPYTVSNQI